MKKYFKNLFSWHSSASRTLWWSIAIPTFIPWIVLGPAIFVSALFLPFFFLSALHFLLGILIFPLLVLLVLLTLYVGIHVLYIVVSIRRYKDLGKSPLWFLIIFIPVVGVFFQVLELGFFAGKKNEELLA